MRTITISWVLVLGFVLTGTAVAAGPSGRAPARVIRGYKVHVQAGRNVSAAQLAPQVAQVEQFLETVHTAMRGQPIRLFDKVVIQPKGMIGRRMKLDLKKRTLYVRPTVGKFRKQPKTISEKSMEKLWDKGTPLGIMIPGKLRKAWGVANPIGKVRLLLRGGIETIGLELGKRAKRASDGRASLPTMKKRVIEMLTQSVDADYKRPGAKKTLVEEAIARVNKMKSKKEVKEFAQSIGKFANSSSNWASLSDAAMNPQTEGENWNVKQLQLFGVQFSNFKDITVAASMSLSSDYPSFRAFVKAKTAPSNKPRATRKLMQLQLFGAQILPVDNVDVKAAFSTGRALGTASVQNALQQIIE